MRWPWNKTFRIDFGPQDSPEELEAKLALVKKAEKITYFETTIEPPTPKQNHTPVILPEEELTAIIDDPEQSHLIRTIAFFYRMHRAINAGITVYSEHEMGLFDNCDMIFIVRSPGYQGRSRFKSWLRRILIKWHLIEEYV